GPFLRHLNLRGCIQLKPDDLSRLAQIKSLVSLSLEGCSIKDGSSLACLLSRNPFLKKLDVSGLLGVTDKVAEEMSNNCRDLEVLDLGWCSNLSGVGLLNIVSFCTNLKRLRLCESTAFNGHQTTPEIMVALR